MDGLLRANDNDPDELKAFPGGHEGGSRKAYERVCAKKKIRQKTDKQGGTTWGVRIWIIAER